MDAKTYSIFETIYMETRLFLTTAQSFSEVRNRILATRLFPENGFAEDPNQPVIIVGSQVASWIDVWGYGIWFSPDTSGFTCKQLGVSRLGTLMGLNLCISDLIPPALLVELRSGVSAKLDGHWFSNGVAQPTGDPYISHNWSDIVDIWLKDQ